MMTPAAVAAGKPARRRRKTFPGGVVVPFTAKTGAVMEDPGAEGGVVIASPFTIQSLLMNPRASLAEELARDRDVRPGRQSFAFHENLKLETKQLSIAA